MREQTACLLAQYVWHSASIPIMKWGVDSHDVGWPYGRTTAWLLLLFTIGRTFGTGKRVFW